MTVAGLMTTGEMTDVTTAVMTADLIAVMTALMNVEEEAAGVVHLAAMIVDLTVGMTAGMIVGMIEDRCVVTTAVTTDEMTVEKNAAVVEEAGGVDLVMTVDHLCDVMTADHQCVGMIVAMTAGMTEVDSDEEEATVTAVAGMTGVVGMTVVVEMTVVKTIGGQDHAGFHLHQHVMTDVMIGTDKDSLRGTMDLQNVQLSLNNSLNSNNNKEERPMVGQLWSNVDKLMLQ